MTNDREEAHRPLKEPDREDILEGRLDRLEDYQSPIGRNKVLFIDLKFVKFGVSDRLQGAAILLSIILLGMAFTALVAGIFDVDWAREVLVWISSPLMLAIGVAVGRGGKVDAGKISKAYDPQFHSEVCSTLGKGCCF